MRPSRHYAVKNLTPKNLLYSLRSVVLLSASKSYLATPEVQPRNPRSPRVLFPETFCKVLHENSFRRDRRRLSKDLLKNVYLQSYQKGTSFSIRKSERFPLSATSAPPFHFPLAVPSSERGYRPRTFPRSVSPHKKTRTGEITSVRTKFSPLRRSSKGLNSVCGTRVVQVVRR